MPESWLCVDCGVDTAPGFLNRGELELAVAKAELKGEGDKGAPQTLDDRAEVFTVRAAVWKASGMEPMGGCLCIGCLEQRLGRKLRPKDFQRDHAFATCPGTQRLRERRDGLAAVLARRP
jgi:hypothetical protein